MTAPAAWGLGYRIEKILARRIYLPVMPEAEPAHQGQAWHLIGHVDLPEPFVCALLSDAGARTIKAAASLVVQPQDDPLSTWRVRAGFVPELSALLRVGGLTGNSGTEYTARLYSETCTISPRRSDRMVGVLAEFQIEPNGPGPHKVEIELTSRSQQVSVLHLNLPMPRRKTRCRSFSRIKALAQDSSSSSSKRQ